MIKPDYVKDIRPALLRIIDQIDKSGIEFTHVVGIMRGGLVPAVHLSHYYNLPFVALTIENNRIDYLEKEEIPPLTPLSTTLLVDDISDSGKTLARTYASMSVFAGKVYTAALHYKEGSVFEPDFYGIKIPQEHPWVVYPWENTACNCHKEILS